MSRYRAERQTWASWCEHENCETLHRNARRFRWVSLATGFRGHEVERSEWIVIDGETGERADHRDLCDPYDRRRDAVAAIASVERREEGAAV